MRTDITFVKRYLQYLHRTSTLKVLGFDTIFAWAAAVPTTSTITKLVSTACYDNNDQTNAADAIINAIHARICISLGIKNHSNTSSKIFDDVLYAVSALSHVRRSFLISLIPASITALGALAYNTLVSPLQTPSELACAILCPSFLILLASLIACTTFLPSFTITLHPASGTQNIKVTPDSHYYEILRLFNKSVNHPGNLAFTYTIKAIANKVSLKYRIPHLHSMSDPLDGIPNQYVFEHESKDHPYDTTPMFQYDIQPAATPIGV